MKDLLVVLAIVIVLTPSLAQASEEAQGCVKPSIIAGGIARVVATESPKQSLLQIKKEWPTQVEAWECTPTGCTSFFRMGRVISSEYQCAEKIDLHPPSSDGTLALSIGIYYSNQSKAAVIRAGREFARAAGAPEENISEWSGDEQRFSWRTGKGQINSVNARVFRRQGLWTTFFTLDLFLIEHTPQVQETTEK